MVSFIKIEPVVYSIKYSISKWLWFNKTPSFSGCWWPQAGLDLDFKSSLIIMCRRYVFYRIWTMSGFSAAWILLFVYSKMWTFKALLLWPKLLWPSSNKKNSCCCICLTSVTVGFTRPLGLVTWCFLHAWLTSDPVKLKIMCGSWLFGRHCS